MQAILRDRRGPKAQTEGPAAAPRDRVRTRHVGRSFGGAPGRKRRSQKIEKRGVSAICCQSCCAKNCDFYMLVRVSTFLQDGRKVWVVALHYSHVLLLALFLAKATTRTTTTSTTTAPTTTKPATTTTTATATATTTTTTTTSLTSLPLLPATEHHK